jgi:hypothetical protein
MRQEAAFPPSPGPRCCSRRSTISWPRGRIRTPVIPVARLGPWAFSPQTSSVGTHGFFRPLDEDVMAGPSPVLYPQFGIGQPCLVVDGRRIKRHETHCGGDPTGRRPGRARSARRLPGIASGSRPMGAAGGHRFLLFSLPGIVRLSLIGDAGFVVSRRCRFRPIRLI